jgi:hypothetical protein
VLLTALAALATKLVLAGFIKKFIGGVIAVIFVFGLIVGLVLGRLFSRR